MTGVDLVEAVCSPSDGGVEVASGLQVIILPWGVRKRGVLQDPCPKDNPFVQVVWHTVNRCPDVSGRTNSK